MTTTRITNEYGDRVEVETATVETDGVTELTIARAGSTGLPDGSASVPLTAFERRALADALDPKRGLSPAAVAEVERWATDRRTARDEARRTAGDIAAGGRSCRWLVRDVGRAVQRKCGAVGARWTALMFDPTGYTETTAVAVCDLHAETARGEGWDVRPHQPVGHADGENGPEPIVPPAHVPPGVVVKADAIDGGYVAEATGLPGCVSQGDTVAEAVANLRDAMTEVVAANAAAVTSEGQADG